MDSLKNEEIFADFSRYLFERKSVLAENYDYFFTFQQSALRGWLIGIVKN